jgi:Protein of unknown function (DUF1073)
MTLFKDTSVNGWQGVAAPLIAKNSNYNHYTPEWTELDWLKKLIITTLVSAMHGQGWEIRNNLKLSQDLNAAFQLKHYDRLLLEVSYFAFLKGHCVLLWAFEDGALPQEEADTSADNRPYKLLHNPRVAGAGDFYPGVYDADEQQEFIDKWHSQTFLGVYDSTYRSNAIECPLASYYSRLDAGGQIWLALPKTLDNGNASEQVLIHPSRWAAANTSYDGHLFSSPWLPTIAEPVDNFNVSAKSMVDILRGTSTMIYGMENLWDVIESKDSLETLKIRLEGIKEAFTKYSVVPKDKERETFEWSSRPLDGMPSVSDELRRNVTASAGMTDTLLWGMKGSGFGNEKDGQSFAQTIRGFQNLILKPIINFIIPIVAVEFGIDVPEDAVVEFMPIEPETQGERSSRIGTDDLIVNPPPTVE